MIGEEKLTCERGEETSASGVWSSEPPTCDGQLTSAGQNTHLFNLDVLLSWLKYRETG